MLGLPNAIRGCLFDLDGVLTRTASVHAAAWKDMLDDFLRERARRDGRRFVPFDVNADYSRFVDGRRREDGTRALLASRGITLPEGTADDTPGEETIHGLSNRKNEIVLQRMAADGVKVFEGSVRYVRAVREAGLRVAVVSASANTSQVLDSAGISDLFDVRIDGVIAAERELEGKPAPDTFLAGADAIGLPVTEVAVFEDALAGVQAGRAGRFAFVVGVDRNGQADLLRRRGADIVVNDLAELLDEQ